MHITQAHINQRLYFGDDLGFLAEELKGFVDGHVEYIGYVFVLVGNVQYMLFNAFTAAGFAGKEIISHKLRRGRRGGGARAGGAAAARGGGGGGGGRGPGGGGAGGGRI